MKIMRSFWKISVPAVLPGWLFLLLMDREYLNPKEIIRIEADRSYSWFHIVDRHKILVSRHLKEFQDLLNDRNFFRPHNSHLINLEFVKKFIRHDGGYIEMMDGSQIPISRNRKDLFLAHMARYTG